jgi:hypothetical protein
VGEAGDEVDAIAIAAKDQAALTKLHPLVEEGSTDIEAPFAWHGRV